MMAILIFLALGAIAALHVAWGLGVHWPAPDERALVSLVIGATGATRMPSLVACLAAAAAILTAGLMALVLAGYLRLPLPRTLITVAGAVTVLVFAARGAAAYLPAWRRNFSQEPFATLDRSWYGPFCLLLAVAFAILLIDHMSGT